MTGEDIWTVFYKNIDLIQDIDKLVYFYRIQNLDRALRITTKVLKDFSETVPFYSGIADFLNEDMVRFDIEYVSGILESLLSAQESQDYELLPDLYELQLLPFIKDIQGKIILANGGVPVYNRYLYRENYRLLKEKMPELAEALNNAYIPQRILEEGYTVEYTGAGLPTLKVSTGDGEYYLHSNGHPVKEAFYWAREHKVPAAGRLGYLSDREYDKDGRMLSSTDFQYIIYGMGLGYHVKALAQAEPYTFIRVFESDINVLQLLCAYADMAYFVKNKNIEVVYDPQFHKLNEALSLMGEDGENGKFLVHRPSLCVIKSPYMKQKIENYFIQYSSISNQLVHLNGNFEGNLMVYDAPADELGNDFEGKDLIVVAAGPSLDKNFKKLHDVRKDSIILATSTVFHKLMDEGIRPDYMIVTDANPRVIYHIRDYDCQDVPVILLSTACRAFGERYGGKKYLMLQRGYKPAENMAKKTGRILFETGGSVSTAALDLGLRLSCRRIIFIGLDLSFPNDMAHAEGTSRRKITEIQGLREVQAVSGGMVKTNKSMDMYREWMEKRLRERTSEEKITKVIDATEGGALINGMETASFEETFQGERRGNILVIKGTAKYGVMRNFADEVMEGMKKEGVIITLFDAKTDPAEKLMGLVEKNYDMVFAFNGVFTSADLPASVIEKLTGDGRNFCVSWFVDHPCHHDMRLRAFPKNNRVLFVDWEHVELVKEYFPDINPDFLPHGGDVYHGEIKSWNERSIDVLFCGSCYDVPEYEKVIEGMEPFLGCVLRESLTLLKENPSYTVRYAMSEVLRIKGVEKERINFGDANMLSLHRFLDDYIRTWFRQRILAQLAEDGVKVALCGEGWDKFSDETLSEDKRKNLIMLGALNYEQALGKMADAKIVLNVMPWFKDGSHERVFTAMRNGAVCLTDRSAYLEEELRDYKSVQFYSLDELDKLSDLVNAILSGKPEFDGEFVNMEEEILKAKKYADENHTWQRRGRELLELLGKRE